MDYRVIPGDNDAGDLSLSHVSVNFDRTGMQADWNVAFPLDRLKELARDKVIGSIAAFHYSFMGAISPVTKYEAKARELAGMLRAESGSGRSPRWRMERVRAVSRSPTASCAS